MNESFIKRIIKKPPTLFPLVALFHVAMLLFSIWNASSEPLSSFIWLEPLWALAYTICWLFVCDMKRWAAYSYLILTAANLTLFALHVNDYGSAMFLMDIVFSFFIMVYIKKFE